MNYGQNRCTIGSRMNQDGTYLNVRKDTKIFAVEQVLELGWRWWGVGVDLRIYFLHFN